MPKTNKKKLVFSYLIGLFLFQELVFRIIFPLPEIENLDRVHYQNLAGGELAATHLRNQNWYWESSPDTNARFLHQMNLYGFRDKEWKIQKTAGKQRVLFIGDSFVEGVMAEQNQSIPISFKAQDANDQYEVMNAGMLGKGLNEYLQLLADISPIFQPDVVFFCIYANDLGKSKVLAPTHILEPQYFGPLKPRLLEIIQQIRTRGTVYARWARPTKAFIPAVPQDNNPWTKNEAELQAHVIPELQQAMKNGTFNPFRANALAKEEAALKSPPQLGETMPFLDYQSKQYGFRPVVVYLPSRNQISNYYLQFDRLSCQVECSDSLDLTTADYQIHQKVIAEQCQQFGIPFIDLTESLRVREKQGEHLYWKYDEHMRGRGYEFAGKLIWEKWQK